MADEEEEFSEGGEEAGGEEGGEEEAIEPLLLDREQAGQSLSLLCKTSSGLSHAYVRMDLRNKDLTDISVVASFVHVRYVDISGNHLEDISALSSLPSLLTIKADNNRLTTAKLEPLAYLQTASFANNRIGSTDGISHPLLEVLNLAGNQLTELTDLSRDHLPSLRVLDLHGNQLTSMAGINIPSLERLYAASNRLTGMDGLGQLRQLTTLHVRSNPITSLDGFSPSMEALQYLNLRANEVSELGEVSKLGCLPMLRALVLGECPVSETDDYRLEVLVSLPRLERLDKDPFTEEERADAEEVAQQRQEGGEGSEEGS